MGLSYGYVVPHSPNLVPEVGRHKTSEASRTIEAMEELGIVIAERRIRHCVIVSPHSPFMPEAFGVWQGGRLTGSMERFQAPDVTVTLDVSTELAEAVLDVATRMELPVERMRRDWRLDRGVTVPSVYLLKTDEVTVVPVSMSMFGVDEHWLFGTAIAKAAEEVSGTTAIISSSNLSHRITPDAPHGYSAAGAEFDGRIRDAVERGQLREILDIPEDLTREASECGYMPLIVCGGAFDGRRVKGRVLSYEAPFGIGYLVAEISLAEGTDELEHVYAGARESVGAVEEQGNGPEPGEFLEPSW